MHLKFNLNMVYLSWYFLKNLFVELTCPRNQDRSLFVIFAFHEHDAMNCHYSSNYKNKLSNFQISIVKSHGKMLSQYFHFRYGPQPHYYGPMFYWNSFIRKILYSIYIVFEIITVKAMGFCVFVRMLPMARLWRMSLVNPCRLSSYLPMRFANSRNSSWPS